MPCWTRNKITVKRQVKNWEAMKKALNKLKIKFSERNNTLYAGDIEIRAESVKCQDWQTQQIDNIFEQYAEEVVREWAVDNNFVIESESNREFVMVQY